MTVAFFGHAEIYDVDLTDAIFQVLQNLDLNEKSTFYLGVNGKFDYYSLQGCLKFKKVYGNEKLCFVTAYTDERYLKNREALISVCDEVIYPDIENVPLKYAIAERNKRVVEMADVVICYINHSWGGAFSAVKYACRIKKRIINLGSCELR